MEPSAHIPRATAHDIDRHIAPRLHLSGDRAAKVGYLTDMMTLGRNNIAPLRWGMNTRELDASLDAFAHHHETQQHFSHAELTHVRQVFHEQFSHGRPS